MPTDAGGAMFSGDLGHGAEKAADIVRVVLSEQCTVCGFRADADAFFSIRGADQAQEHA